MFGPQHFADIHVIRAFLDIKTKNSLLILNHNCNSIESQKTNFLDD